MGTGKTGIAAPHAESSASSAVVPPTVCSANQAIKFQLVSAATAPSVQRGALPARTLSAVPASIITIYQMEAVLISHPTAAVSPTASTAN